MAVAAIVESGRAGAISEAQAAADNTILGNILATGDPTGRAPLLLGLKAELHGHTLHAEICRAALVPTMVDPEAPPHAELNTKHPEAGTALHWASEQRLHQAALALIGCRHFALTNAVRPTDKSTALHIAAAAGSEEVVEAILLHPDCFCVGSVDCDGFTALHGAAFGGHVACVKLLLANSDGLASASVEGTFDMPRPAGHWAIEAAKICDMRTALHMAAARGHVEVCRLLLGLTPPASSCGADAINRLGATALHMAARAHHTAACLVILQSPNFTAVNARDTRGFTALHWAAHQPSGHICAALLERQDFLQIDGTDLRGRSATQIARAEGYHEVVRLCALARAAQGLSPSW